MRVLIACESSWTVRNAFRALGHDAWSCDLLDADDGSEYHIKGDCLAAIHGDKPWYLLIAHPPCQRWGKMWFGSPSYVARTGIKKKKGDDGGCFEAALAAVRRCGGVLEHPYGSHAWAHFGLAKPSRKGGWIKADDFGGWTCCVVGEFFSNDGFRERIVFNTKHFIKILENQHEHMPK